MRQKFGDLVLLGNFEGETLIRSVIKYDFPMTNDFSEKEIVARIVKHDQVNVFFQDGADPADQRQFIFHSGSDVAVTKKNREVYIALKRVFSARLRSEHISEFHAVSLKKCDHFRVGGESRNGK